MALDLGAGSRRVGVAAAAGAQRGNGGEDGEAPLVVKGFEDPVLVAALREVVGRVRGCVEWTEVVWADLFEPGSEGTGVEGVAAAEG